MANETDIEKLPFDQFEKLSDEEILRCDREKLIAYALASNLESNVILHRVVLEYHTIELR